MDQEDRRQTLGEVFGSAIELFPLPTGWTPIEGLFLVKCLDETGTPTWAIRETEKLNVEEMIGVLTVQLDILREQTVNAFRAEDGSL